MSPTDAVLETRRRPLGASRGEPAPRPFTTAATVSTNTPIGCGLCQRSSVPRHWPLGGGEVSPSTSAGVYTQTAKAESGVPFMAPA